MQAMYLFSLEEHMTGDFLRLIVGVFCFGCFENGFISVMSATASVALLIPISSFKVSAGHSNIPV